MFFVVAWIAFAVVGILAGIFFAHKERGDYVFNATIGLIVGAMSGLVVPGIVAMIASNNIADANGYSNVEEYELVALATQQETEGSAGMLIFVGWGQVGETRTAYWTAKDADGIAKMYSVNAMEILVKETETTPLYIKQAKVDDTLFWFPYISNYEVREYLEVPVGTLTANYEFQP